MSVGQIATNIISLTVTLETIRNEVDVVQFQVLSQQLSRRGRKTTKDAFTLAGLRADESIPDNPTVNSLTSQFSSKVRTEALLQC